MTLLVTRSACAETGFFQVEIALFDAHHSFLVMALADSDLSY
jgi:hypothetical protein